MTLPEIGGVVIIDDQPTEALPIINALSKKGISCTYYQGANPNLLPDSPSQIVRLVFLDLQLIETTDDNHITKTIIDILNKIISKDNGPFILVIWSKNRAKYESIISLEIKKHEHLYPSCIIGFNKRDCLEEKIIFKNSEDLIAETLDKLKGRFEDEDLETIKKVIEEVSKSDYTVEYTVKQDAIEIIESNIKKELENAGVFHLFVIWENLIRQSASNTVFAVSKTIEASDLWEQNMRDVIKRMAKARAGQNKLDKEEILKTALSTFTYSFTEELESSIREHDFPDYINTDSEFIISDKNATNIYKIVSPEENKVALLKDDAVIKGKESVSIQKLVSLINGIPEADQAIVKKMVESYIKIPFEINTKLHIELNPNKELIPGNIYKVNVSADKKNEYLKTYFDNIPDEIEQFTFIELEVSPICDYAQTKWKKSRLVSGVIYPIDISAKSRDHLYKVDPVIMIDGEPKRLIFDFHLFKSLDNQVVEERDIWFRLKRELLLDIIANLSGHVNRPGIAYMT